MVEGVHVLVKFNLP